MKEIKIYIGHSFQYTDDKGYQQKALIDQERLDDFILCLVPDVFREGYTVYKATGGWQGRTEPCTVIEAVGPETDIGPATALAWKAAKRFGQHCVMITVKDVELMRLIGPGVREDY